MGLPTNLDTNLVDVTDIPLAELRSVRTGRLLDTTRDLLDRVRLAERDEIQEQHSIVVQWSA